MNLRRRLQRLERHRPAVSVAVDDPLEEDWLAFFTAWDERGYFAAEPDFPVALAAFHCALEEARQGTPPFDPPADFRPELPAPRRVASWRRQHSYPVVTDAWLWLAELYERVHTGIPPVTEVEFQELAGWFAANDERLAQAAEPSGLLALKAGRQTTCANLRYGLLQGHRAAGAGRLAEDLRRLRERFEKG